MENTYPAPPRTAPGRYAIRALVLTGCGIALCNAPAAFAATTSTTMAVSATVVSACVVTANDLAFGNYNPTSASSTNATTTVEILCTNGTSFTVGLNAGLGSGATVTNRKLTKGTDLLAYALYSDSSRTTNWGNTPGVDTPAATVAGAAPSTMTVYGRITAAQNVPAGNYTDTVTVTVNY